MITYLINLLIKIPYLIFRNFSFDDIIKGEKVKIKGYLEEFALSKAEADQLIMTAREKVYKDWGMKNGEKKIKVIDFKQFQKNF